MFFKIVSRFLRIGLQNFSNVLIWPKNVFFTKFDDGYQNNSEFYADLETVEKNAKKFANKKVTGKRSVQNWSLFSSILLTCKSFWQITFPRYTLFKIFPQIWNQRKNSAFFDTHMLKKKEKKIWGSWSTYHVWVFFADSQEMA